MNTLRLPFSLLPLFASSNLCNEPEKRESMDVVRIIGENKMKIRSENQCYVTVEENKKK
jgi:hypothetical protein